MDAQDELDEVTLFGDIGIAAFFEEDKLKKLEAKLAEFAATVASGNDDRYRGWLAERRDDNALSSTSGALVPKPGPSHLCMSCPKSMVAELNRLDMTTNDGAVDS